MAFFFLFLQLTGDEVYKELRLRGYEYKDEFKGVVQSDNRGMVVSPLGAKPKGTIGLHCVPLFVRLSIHQSCQYAVSVFQTFFLNACRY